MPLTEVDVPHNFCNIATLRQKHHETSEQRTTLSCKNFSLAPAVSVLLGQKIFTGQNGNKSSCGTSGTLTAAGRKGFRELTFLRDKCFQRH
jgi:hypothetical protein